MRSTPCKKEQKQNSCPTKKTRHPIKGKTQNKRKFEKFNEKEKKNARMNAGTCGIEAREREENEKKNAWRGYEEGSDREGEVETEKHFCLEQRECLGGS